MPESSNTRFKDVLYFNYNEPQVFERLIYSSLGYLIPELKNAQTILDTAQLVDMAWLPGVPKDVIITRLKSMVKKCNSLYYPMTEEQCLINERLKLGLFDMPNNTKPFLGLKNDRKSLWDIYCVVHWFDRTNEQ